MLPCADPCMPLWDLIKLVLIPEPSLVQNLQSSPQTVFLSLQSTQFLQLLETHRNLNFEVCVTPPDYHKHIHRPTQKASPIGRIAARPSCTGCSAEGRWPLCRSPHMPCAHTHTHREPTSTLRSRCTHTRAHGDKQNRPERAKEMMWQDNRLGR